MPTDCVVSIPFSLLILARHSVNNFPADTNLVRSCGDPVDMLCATLGVVRTGL